MDARSLSEYRDLGFRSQVAGTLKLNVEELVDRRLMRFMGNGAAYAYLSMKQAIEDAGLSEADVSNDRTGLVAGSGGPTTGAIVRRSSWSGVAMAGTVPPPAGQGGALACARWR